MRASLATAMESSGAGGRSAPAIGIRPPPLSHAVRMANASGQARAGIGERYARCIAARHAKWDERLLRLKTLVEDESGG